MDEQTMAAAFLVGFVVVHAAVGCACLWLSHRDAKRQREGYGLA